jgi:hypothetical protein
LIVVALLPIVALAGEARGEGDVAKLVRQALDSSLKLPEREAALSKAVSFAHNKAIAKRAEDLRPAVPTLVKELYPKRADPAYEGLLLHTFAAFTCFAPDPELSALTRPFFGKDTPNSIRRGAINALSVHGAGGLSKEIVAIFEEPTDDATKSEHEILEREILLIVAPTPANDALAILTAAAKQKTVPGVRVAALQELTKFANTRPADATPELMRATLKPFITDKNAEVATLAALAIQRYNSWEGVEALVAREGNDPKRWTRDIYRAVCRAVYAGGGFDGVVPEKFNECDAATRAIAISSLLKRWEDVKSKSPEDVFWQMLAGAGVTPPADKKSREVVAALIDGLDAESREIRYSALDMFVRRTGRTDVGKDFKMLINKSGPAKMQLEIRLPEPADGFKAPEDAEKLRAQQKTMAKELRSWWDRNGKKAELQGDVWVIPPEKQEKPKSK